MIVKDHHDLPEMDRDRWVPAVLSLPGAFARSVGTTLQDVPTLFGQPDLDQGHARMTGRWSFPAPALGPLQRMTNAMLFDAHNLASEDVDDVPSESITALAYGRAILLSAFNLDGDTDFIAEELAHASDVMREHGPTDDQRADAGARYASFLPDDRLVEIIDPGTVHSVLGLLIGLQRAELMECGVPKSKASAYLNGREDWENEEAVRMLARRAALVARRLREALPYGDDEADDLHRLGIHQLTPAETATAWQLFPVARTEIERWSPWLFKFGDPECA